MPEVVDSCSLASPASVCRTKHLHLRCSVDFPRRVLTGTAALTVQSQEDNLRSLVRWDARPVPASPRPPASCPSSRRRPFPGPRSGLPRASLGAPAQPTTPVPHLPSALASQPPLPRPHSAYSAPPHRACVRIPRSPATCASVAPPAPLSPTPLPRPSAHPSAASTSCSHPERGLHCSTSPPSPAIRVPSAKPPVASPFPRPAAQNSLLGLRIYSPSPRAPSQATVSSESRTLCPADAHRTLSSTCTSAG